eukprot:COSAG06_NODE_59446_length_274_cov_0.588571_2_plen_23_part_01
MCGFINPSRCMPMKPANAPQLYI